MSSSVRWASPVNEFGGGDVDLSLGTSDEPAPATPVDPLDERRPNVSGDLPSMFQAAPMFRRAIGGYSRFQVDTYVRWAEDELAAAARANEDVLARYAEVSRELDEAQQLLSHSPGGAEFLRLSHRIGGMLAGAADQAQALVSEAQAERDAAATEAERVLAEAAAEAQSILTEGSARAEAIIAEARSVRTEADRLHADAGRAREQARAEAEALLEQAHAVERQALEEAERIRGAATAHSSAIRLQAQHEGVLLLARSREERLRSEAEAAGLRGRLDQEAAARRGALVAEIEQLERRRTLLQADLVNLPQPAARGRRHRKGESRARNTVVPVPRDTSAHSPRVPIMRSGVWKRLGRPVHSGR